MFAVDRRTIARQRVYGTNLALMRIVEASGQDMIMLKSETSMPHRGTMMAVNHLRLERWLTSRPFIFADQWGVEC